MARKKGVCQSPILYRRKSYAQANQRASNNNLHTSDVGSKTVVAGDAQALDRLANFATQHKRLVLARFPTERKAAGKPKVESDRSVAPEAPSSK